MSPSKITRTKRAKRAIDLAWQVIRDLCDELDVIVERVLPDLVKTAPDWQRAMFDSQLPDNGAAFQLIVRDVPDPALWAIVDRASQQIHSSTRPLPDFVTREMKGQLIRGIAMGDHPNATADKIVSRVGDRFDLGRTRAQVVARTEMLDAHRAASRAWDTENADTLTGWQWVAKLDARTCPSCWSMHGRTFDPSVAGPLDHQQGRCTRVPKARSWAELGYPDIEEPPDLMPDAQATFDALPVADQLRIMGARRFELYRSGRVSWGQLSQRRTTTGWRDSFAPTPVRDLAS